MRELVIDLTPTCVNRTAIYHIALDTLKACENHFDIKTQYRGSRASRVLDVAEERMINEAFFRDLVKWAGESVHTDEIFPPELDDQDTTPRLYFDPIYTLYRPLRSGDVVFVLDMSTLTNPEWHGPLVARGYERAFRKLMASPATVVCISEHCATALRTNFSIPETDIVLTPLYLRTLPARTSSDPAFALQPEKFFLFVGSLESRKNLIGLMRAFAMSGLAESGWKLACAGGKGEGADAILAAAADLDGVEMLGFVSDDELSWLYANAAAFAYPSFLEGFGLPLLEAMAHGIPCLASITGASQEVCGELGILVDPYDVSSIVEGLVACSKTNKAAQRDRLIERASRFTFKRYIDALMPAFDPIAA